MDWRRLLAIRLPTLLYTAVGLGLVAQGVRYLGSATIASYHLAVIDASWNAIEPAYQQLLLGLYRGFGAGFVFVGLAILTLTLIPLRTGKRWAIYATPALAGGYTAALIYITATALRQGATPVFVSVVLFITVLVAAILSVSQGRLTD